MLEKPELRNDEIIGCLRHSYGVDVVELTFLPLGADRDTAVYRAVASDGTTYFAKLRKGIFDETAVLLARFLYDQGIPQIIAPLAATIGRLWDSLGAFTVVVYPFIAGQNAYQVRLSDHQWCELGRALKRVHNIPVPPELGGRIMRETYAPRWRNVVKNYLANVTHRTDADPVAARTAALLHDQRGLILDLVGRTEQLAGVLIGHDPRALMEGQHLTFVRSVYN